MANYTMVTWYNLYKANERSIRNGPGAQPEKSPLARRFE